MLLHRERWLELRAQVNQEAPWSASRIKGGYGFTRTAGGVRVLARSRNYALKGPIGNVKVGSNEKVVRGWGGERDSSRLEWRTSAVSRFEKK